jgi:DNA-directed RNA polymerase subunit K/omega
MDINHPDAWLPAYLTDATVDVMRYVHSTPMTKFERATVIGHRALQISQNSLSRVVSQSADPLQIAKEELLAGSLPAMSLGRYLPDGTMIRKFVQDVHAPCRQ